jgi:ribosomal-protein-alanine N-acetyltransferase
VTAVRLLPVPAAVATAVVHGGDLEAALHPLGRAADWPHADSVDALRPLAADPSVAAGTFLIVAGDEVIGECGWLGRPDAQGDVEIGYGVAASARGRGLARAAVAELCRWVARQDGVRRITAEALVGNEPSRRLLLALGFVEEPGTPPFHRYAREV